MFRNKRVDIRHATWRTAQAVQVLCTNFPKSLSWCFPSVLDRQTKLYTYSAIFFIRQSIGRLRTQFLWDIPFQGWPFLVNALRAMRLVSAFTRFTRKFHLNFDMTDLKTFSAQGLTVTGPWFVSICKNLRLWQCTVRSNNWHDFTSFNDSTKARPEGLVMTWRSSEIKKRPRWPRSRAPAQRQNSRRYFFFSLGCEQRHWDMLQRSIKSVWQVTRDMLQRSIKSVWHVTAYPLPHHPPPPHPVPPKKHNILRAQVLTNGQYS